MRRNDWIGAIMLSVGLVLLIGPPGLADEQQNGQPEAEGEIPETAEGIWHAIGDHEGHLAETIEEGKLSEVHRIAFALRDLAAALPEKSTDLSEARQKQLAGYISRIADHAKNLDNYGDNGLQGKTEAEFAQLGKRLDYMRRLYPESMFAHDEHDDEHDGHGGRQ